MVRSINHQGDHRQFITGSASKDTNLEYIYQKGDPSRKLLVSPRNRLTLFLISPAQNREGHEGALSALHRSGQFTTARRLVAPTA